MKAPCLLLEVSPGKNSHWSGLPCSPPGHLPNPGIKPRFPALRADSVPSEPPGKPKLENEIYLLSVRSICISHIYKNIHRQVNVYFFKMETLFYSFLFHLIYGRCFSVLIYMCVCT